MRKRKKGFIIRLTEEELLFLDGKVKEKGISRESYARALLTGYEPRGNPSQYDLEVIRELRRIGNNLNQIAKVANKTYQINIDKYQQVEWQHFCRQFL